MFRQLSTSFGLFFWSLGLRLCPVVQGQVCVIGAAQPVTPRAGDDVTLPCRCEPAVDLTPLTVEWWRVQRMMRPSRYSGDGATVYVYTKRRGEMVIRKSREQTEMFPDQLRAGNASLTLRQVTLFDNGNYTCVIPDLKTSESLRSAQVTLIVQPSDENTITKNPDEEWHFPIVTTGAVILALVPLLLVMVLWVCTCVRPVMWEDVRLVILNSAEPQPTDAPQRTALDAGDATFQ